MKIIKSCRDYIFCSVANPFPFLPDLDPRIGSWKKKRNRILYKNQIYLKLYFKQYYNILRKIYIIIMNIFVVFFVWAKDPNPDSFFYRIQIRVTQKDRIRIRNTDFLFIRSSWIQEGLARSHKVNIDWLNYSARHINQYSKRRPFWNKT